ncbi:MAG: hypothetical protein KDC43_28970 [Saprospiraceae bacterium]|nr:hypothetical protein [Saprospiraceae bacterium]
MVNSYAGVEMGEMVGHINKVAHQPIWLHDPLKFMQDPGEDLRVNVFESIIRKDQIEAIVG